MHTRFVEAVRAKSVRENDYILIIIFVMHTDFWVMCIWQRDVDLNN